MRYQRQELHRIRRCLIGALCLLLIAVLAVNAELDWVTHPHNVFADYQTNSIRVTFIIRVPEEEFAQSIILSIWRSPPQDTIDEFDPRHRSQWSVRSGDYGPWQRTYSISTGRYNVRLNRYFDGKWERVYNDYLNVRR